MNYLQTNSLWTAQNYNHREDVIHITVNMLTLRGYYHRTCDWTLRTCVWYFSPSIVTWASALCCYNRERNSYCETLWSCRNRILWNVVAIEIITENPAWLCARAGSDVDLEKWVSISWKANYQTDSLSSWLRIIYYAHPEFGRLIYFVLIEYTTQIRQLIRFVVPKWVHLLWIDMSLESWITQNNCWANIANRAIIYYIMFK